MQKIIFLLSILFTTQSFAKGLFIKTAENWELKENVMGAEYALIEKGQEKPQSVVFNRIASPVDEKNIDSYAKSVITDSWPDAVIASDEKINWGKDSGKMYRVNFKKGLIPYSALLAIYPVDKEHYFVLYRDETLRFEKEEKILKTILQTVQFK